MSTLSGSAPRASRRLGATAAALGCLVAAAVWVAPSAHADSIRDSEWPVGYLDLPAAHSLSTGSGVTVGLLDSGVVSGRADLSGQVTTGPDYVGGVEHPGQSGWGEHGTCMASIIAGHGRNGGGDGMLGAAPGAHLLSVRVIRDDDAPDFGHATTDATPISDGIKYAVDHGAQVISMSLGGDEADSGDDSSAESDAIRYALAHNVVVVAAAGNGARKGNAVSYPGAERGVIAVAAVDSSGQHADFSTTGWDVAVAAPGVELPCDAYDSDANYLEGSGTSQATAYVAGVVALLKSENPLLSPTQIRNLLEQTAKDKPAGGRDDQIGFGIVNPVAALKAAKSYAGLPPVPQPGPSATGHFGYGPTVAAAAASPGLSARARALLGGGALTALALALAVSLLRRPRRPQVNLTAAHLGYPGAFRAPATHWLRSWARVGRVTDFHGRTLQPTGFEGDDGAAAPGLIEVLAAARQDEAGVYPAYAALAGRRVLVPIVALLGETEAAETLGPDGTALRRDKDSDMAVVTLIAPDGAKALPAFTSTAALTAWGARSGFPQARPIPVTVQTAAAAALQEQAQVLLLDLGGPGQFEISGSALRAFAQGRTPLPPAADPEVTEAINRVLNTVPSVARVLRSARLGQAAEDVTVLALGFAPGTDPKTLEAPLAEVAQGIAADELLRDRLSGGLQIVLTNESVGGRAA